MKPKVYIETSVVSYLTARPSRDVVTLGNQVATREWWREAAGMFELVASSLVIEESAAGDPEAARARLAALESVQMISVETMPRSWAGSWSARVRFRPRLRPMPPTWPSRVVNGVDYLVTWNMKHLANPVAPTRIERFCRDADHEPPVICTPSQLLEMET